MTVRVGTASAFVAASLAITAPAFAQTPVTAAEAARSADDNRLICKKQKRTNSRFEDKTCKTRAQWEELRIQQQRDMKEWIDRPQVDVSRG